MTVAGDDGLEPLTGRATGWVSGHEMDRMNPNASQAGPGVLKSELQQPLPLTSDLGVNEGAEPEGD